MEVAKGKDVLGAEYVLPSGLTLPLGSMISALRRARMVREICGQGGTSRWVPSMFSYEIENVGEEVWGAAQSAAGRDVGASWCNTARLRSCIGYDSKFGA